jgi:hypothetical protein
VRRRDTQLASVRRSPPPSGYGLVKTPRCTKFINLSDIAGLKLAGEIKDAPIFEGMSMFQIKKFVLLGKIADKETGCEIIHLGEEQQDMYILPEGRIQVVGPAEV